MNNSGAPFVAGSSTSEAAAEAIEEGRATLRYKVYKYLLDQGQLGAIDQEMQDDLNMDPSTQRPRRVELVRAGKVKDSGKKRLTRSLRWAVVWVAC